MQTPSTHTNTHTTPTQTKQEKKTNKNTLTHITHFVILQYYELAIKTSSQYCDITNWP
jgi:hypothetical protein